MARIVEATWASSAGWGLYLWLSAVIGASRRGGRSGVGGHRPHCGCQHREALLGIDTVLKELRHYSATELLTAGVDLRTVAGRLGHGDGTTTLRHYAARVGSADTAAPGSIGGRMPTLRPVDRS
jgi:integrase